jgi:hypothetical protein
MSMRRFTRLNNGRSKKFHNHTAAVALHYMHYNFCRIHKTYELLNVEKKHGKRPYKKPTAAN